MTDVTYYTYVKYSSKADGSDMVDTPETTDGYLTDTNGNYVLDVSGNKILIHTKTLYKGVCKTTDTSAPTESTRYKWTLIERDKRLELHEILCSLLGSRNVYFQPPESVQMKYPAIVYSLDDIDQVYANGEVYLYTKEYSVTLITDDPDSKVVDKMAMLINCRFERSYVSDNLNHYIFDIYY